MEQSQILSVRQNSYDDMDPRLMGSKHGRHHQHGKRRHGGHKSGVPPPEFYPERPSSEQLTDLHIYIVPPQYWNDQYNCCYNTVMNYTISAGFIRVFPETRLEELRNTIREQIGKQQGSSLPKQFIFLKSVGRALTQVKGHQEKQLKVKNFLPPFAYCPELFIMNKDRLSQKAPYPRGAHSGVHHVAGGESHRHTYLPMGHGGYEDGSTYQGYPSGPPCSATPPGSGGAFGLPQDAASMWSESSESEDEAAAPPPKSQATAAAKSQATPPTKSQATAVSGSKREDLREMERNMAEKERLAQERQRETERGLAEKQREIERELGEKQREIENKQRELEREAAEKQREFERLIQEEKRQIEDQRFKMERELQDQRDKQERELREMQRELERQQQEDYYKRQKEMEEQSREREKEAEKRHREMEKRLQEQDAEIRKRMQEAERQMMDKEREIERQKMELEKKQMEKEKNMMQQAQEMERKKAELDKIKQEGEKERARLEQQKKMQENSEKLVALSQNTELQLEGRSSSRPNSSPTKLKFPRAASPQLREEFSHKLQELNQLKVDRQEMEVYREDLIKKAKGLQAKAQFKRAQARDHWKKKYFEEKKKTTPLEEHSNKLRRELDTLNRRIISRLEKERESQQDTSMAFTAQNKIILARMQHDLDDLRQRVEDAKMKLMAEIKLRNQAENELKALRAEVVQKKINAGMNRELQRTAIEA